MTPLPSFSIDLKVSLYPFSNKDVSVSVGKHGIMTYLLARVRVGSPALCLLCSIRYGETWRIHGEVVHASEKWRIVLEEKSLKEVVTP